MQIIIKTLELTKMHIKCHVTYVAAAWASILVNIMQIFIFYYLWMAVYGQNSTVNGIDKYQIITYVILANILSTLVSWGLNLEISDDIRTGHIVVDLIKPIDFELKHYMSRLAGTVTSIIFRSMPILIISIFIFKILPPLNLISASMFILSVFLGITIAFLIEFCMGLIGFYTTNGWGIMILKGAIISFFSGALIPMNFFPPFLKRIADILPFKNLVYGPISIYLGLDQKSLGFNVLLSQFVWIIILFIITRIFYSVAIKRVTVQGG